MRIYIVRHGFSEDNLEKRFHNSGEGFPVTVLGQEQSARLSESFASLPITRVIASPLMRATQTAEFIARMLGLSVETNEALREFDVGRYEGTVNPAGWEEYDRVQRAWFIDGNTSARVGGGESLDEIRARFRKFFNQFVDENLVTDVVLVGHSGTFRAVFSDIVPNLLAKTVYENELGFGEVAVLDRENGVFVCTNWPRTGETRIEIG